MGHDKRHIRKPVRNGNDIGGLQFRVDLHRRMMFGCQRKEFVGIIRHQIPMINRVELDAHAFGLPEHPVRLFQGSFIPGINDHPLIEILLFLATAVHPFIFRFDMNRTQYGTKGGAEHGADIGPGFQLPQILILDGIHGMLFCIIRAAGIDMAVGINSNHRKPPVAVSDSPQVLCSCIFGRHHAWQPRF